MNGAHVHLIFNHFPLIGFVLAFPLLVWGLIRSNKDFMRASLVVIIMAGVFTLPTYFSGEDAEEAIENRPGISKELIHTHEEAAEYAIIFTEITALAALIALILSVKKDRLPKPLIIVILLLQIFTMTVLATTNNHGGKISHPEIRDDANTSEPSST